MNRILLRFFNPVFLLLIGMLLVAIQSSLFARWPLNYLRPDPVLLLVVWCALRRPLIEGGILVLLLARTQELHSAIPSGVAMSAHMAVYLGVALANQVLVVPNFRSYARMTAIAYILGHISALVLLGLLGTFAGTGGGWGWKSSLIWIFPQAVVEGALALWAFPWLERFDIVTYKVAQPELELEGLEEVGVV